MTMYSAAAVLAAGGALCDRAAVTLDGEERIVEPVPTGFVFGAAPSARYGILIGPGRVSGIVLGALPWRAVDCDLTLTEQTELTVTIRLDLPGFLDGSDCRLLRALLGADTLPAVDIDGQPAAFAAAGEALRVTFPGAGALRENGRAIGFVHSDPARPAGTACGIARRYPTRPRTAAAMPIAGRVVPRALGERVATDGSATYRVEGDAAECDGARLRVYRARAFDVSEGRLYGLGAGFVTDGTTYAAAPEREPLEFRAIAQGGQTRFFLRFDDRWEAWDLAGNRLFVSLGVFTRSAFSADYLLYRNGAAYELRDKNFQRLQNAVLDAVMSWEISGEGFFGDVFYAVKGQGERLYCRLGDGENYIYAGLPFAGAYAANGLTAAYAVADAVRVEVPGRSSVAIRPGLGAVRRLEWGRDCLYAWCDDGEAALYADEWLALTADAECETAGAVSAEISLEAEDVSGQ